MRTTPKLSPDQRTVELSVVDTQLQEDAQPQAHVEISFPSSAPTLEPPQYVDASLSTQPARTNSNRFYAGLDVLLWADSGEEGLQGSHDAPRPRPIARAASYEDFF